MRHGFATVPQDGESNVSVPSRKAVIDLSDMSGTGSISSDVIRLQALRGGILPALSPMMSIKPTWRGEGPKVPV